MKLRDLLAYSRSDKELKQKDHLLQSFELCYLQVLLVWLNILLNIQFDLISILMCFKNILKNSYWPFGTHNEIQLLNFFFFF